MLIKCETTDFCCIGFSRFFDACDVGRANTVILNIFISVTGLSLEMSIVAIGVVCTFYTALVSISLT